MQLLLMLLLLRPSQTALVGWNFISLSVVYCVVLLFTLSDYELDLFAVDGLGLFISNSCGGGSISIASSSSTLALALALLGKRDFILFLSLLISNFSWCDRWVAILLARNT